MSERTYDVVLFGATGFTGKLTAEYLAKQKPRSWAIAGRSKDKLEKVKKDLGLDVPILVADADDEKALDALAPQTKVVCTTVGPYAKYGKKLASACARSGTHYCDLTGEVTFIRWSIDANHEAALKSGARIVHCCGFDSIPFDLGLHMVWTNAGKKPLAWAKSLVKMKGGASGGTIASMMTLMEEAEKSKDTRRLLADPFSLDPVRGKVHPDDQPKDVHGARFDRDLGRWTGPFIMAAVNTRVVRRSNALLEYAYGEKLRYSEAMVFPKGASGWLSASMLAGGLGAFAGLAAMGPTRSFVQRFLPKPGEGPTPEQQKAGFFDVTILAETESGDRLRGKVGADGDPGYSQTAVMLGESALCLAAGVGERAGVLTPATAMGMTLVDRLRNAGMRFLSE
jgi:short subunit dehydrogenase-like uncharacterized protein